MPTKSFRAQRKWQPPPRAQSSLSGTQKRLRINQKLRMAHILNTTCFPQAQSSIKIILEARNVEMTLSTPSKKLR